MNIEDVFSGYDKAILSEMIETATGAGLSLDEAVEYVACYLSRDYFIDTFVQIYDPVTKEWIPFRLWDAQKRFLKKIDTNQTVVAFKARQVGLSWSALAYSLHEFLFRPPAMITIISKTDLDAKYLMGEERLKGMYDRLPEYLRAQEAIKDNTEEMKIRRGGKDLSVVRSVSTKRGDGLTGTVVIIDEADVMQDLEQVMKNVEPVVNAGGKLIIISKSDRSRPDSYMKKFYKAAKAGRIPRAAAEFIAWYEHPGRDRAWYAAQVARSLETTQTLDEVYENYPATDEEALSPLQASKRFPANQLLAVYSKAEPLTEPAVSIMGIPGLKIYELPLPGLGYALGTDTAEGLPHSDNSVSIVTEKRTGRVCAVLCGKIAPDIHASYAKMIADFYNYAVELPENNFHGQAYIQAALLNGNRIIFFDGEKPGWTNTRPNKINLFNMGAPRIRDGKTALRDEGLYNELASIDLNKLEGKPNDDRAIAYLLSLQALDWAYEDPTASRSYADRNRNRRGGSGQFTGLDLYDWEV